MKKILIGLLGLVFLLTACTSQQQTPTEPQSIIIEPPTQAPVKMTPAEIAAVTLLSKTLDLSAEKIEVVSAEAVTWPDGCLGIVRIGVMCTQAEVPGFKIVLNANGEEYEIHTNKDGSVAQIVATSQTMTELEMIVVKQLAQNLDLKEDDISVVSDTTIEFSDACLGVSMENVMCAQVVTPGNIIVLEANGTQYEYHTNEDGTRIQPATLALTWKREGGIAGFCDYMSIFLSGEIYGSQCKDQDGRMGTFADLLTAADRSRFVEWMNKYGQATLDESDPQGVADGMTRVIELYGSDHGKPGKTVEQEIFIWADELYQKLYN